MPYVRPMDDGPATSLDIVDQDVEATEVIDDPADETFYRFGFDQVRPEDQVGGRLFGKSLLKIRQALFPIVIVKGDTGSLSGKGQADTLADALDGTEH